LLALSPPAIDVGTGMSPHQEPITQPGYGYRVGRLAAFIATASATIVPFSPPPGRPGRAPVPNARGREGATI